jgi:hypothetical protein
MDDLLDGERAVEATVPAAIGVCRERAELTIMLPSGRLAYMELIKVPPGEDPGLFPLPGKRVNFGDGITLLVRFTG